MFTRSHLSLLLARSSACTVTMHVFVVASASTQVSTAPYRVYTPHAYTHRLKWMMAENICGWSKQVLQS